MAFEDFTNADIVANINRLQVELAEYDGKEVPHTMRIAVNAKKKELLEYTNELNKRNGGSFDSDATSYGRPGGEFHKPTPQGEVPEGGAFFDIEIARQEIYGHTHKSLNVFDALDGMVGGYTDVQKKNFKKEYLDPQVKKPQKKPHNPVKQPYNPVKQNPLKRTWD